MAAAVEAHDTIGAKTSLEAEGVEAEQWLAHIEALVTRAEDPIQDLRTRLASVAKASSALDAFFLVRGAAPQQEQAHSLKESPTPIATIGALSDRCSLAFTDKLVPALRDRGVSLRGPRDLAGPQRARSKDIFANAIFPLLTPMSVDPGRPFPHIANLSLNVAAVVEDSHGRSRFVRIEVPRHLPRFLGLGEVGVFVAIENIITANLHHIVHGARARAHHTFRVTRQVGVEAVNEASAFEAVPRKPRMDHARPPVRLEVEAAMPPWLVDFLIDRVGVTRSRTYAVRGPLDLSQAPGLLPEEHVSHASQRVQQVI